MHYNKQVEIGIDTLSAVLPVSIHIVSCYLANSVYILLTKVANPYFMILNLSLGYQFKKVFVCVLNFSRFLSYINAYRIPPPNVTVLF